MIKKPIKIHREEVSSEFKCGDCVHLSKEPLFENKVCSQLGIKHYAAAPIRCFTPNAYLLNTESPEVLFQLGLLLKNFNPRQARIIRAILQQHTKLQKKFKLQFGQPVFFRFGGDYLSNYYRGYVTSFNDVEEGVIYVTSDLGRKQRKQPLTARLPRESLYTITEYKKKREQLIKLKRLNDPKPLFAANAVKVDETHVPPTMENAPKEWFDKKEARPRKKVPAKFQVINGQLSFKVIR